MDTIKNHPNFEKMVRSFASNDDFRISITQPICYENGWVASTNSHKLIWFHDPEFVKKENILDYSKGEGANAQGILEKYQNIYQGDRQPIGRIDLEKVREVFSEIQKEPEYEKKYRDCDECEGFGTVECNCCGHETSCDECDGEGTVECGQEETGYYKFPQGHYIKIGDNHFSLNEFSEVLEYFDLVGVKELDVYVDNDSLKSFFGVPNDTVYLLFMGCIVNNQDDVEKFYNIPYLLS
jgi:hypothetical protein